MTRTLITALTVCACLASFEALPDVDESVLQGCRACHRGAADLNTQTAEELIVSITAIANGEASHPLALPALSPEDIEAVARALGE